MVTAVTPTKITTEACRRRAVASLPKKYLESVVWKNRLYDMSAPSFVLCGEARRRVVLLTYEGPIENASTSANRASNSVVESPWI